MGWRKLMKVENETLSTISAKGTKASQEKPFAGIVDIADRDLKSNWGNKKIHSHKNTKNVFPPLSAYPDCRGWKLADLTAWQRCLECEWDWWQDGAHVCMKQEDMRVDRAMRTCPLKNGDDAKDDETAAREAAAWKE